METAQAAVLFPQTPQRLKMTYEEFLDWADEDVHAEWVNGEVIVSMPPNIRHQLVAGFLFALLRLCVDYLKVGVVLAAPTEMKLSPDGSAREPDILVITTE